MAETFKYIGAKDNRRKEGYAKVSGQAVYTRDLTLPGMLYARVLASPYGHARIKSMDTTEAEALPGVRYVLRYDDTGPNMKGRIYRGEEGEDNRFAVIRAGRAGGHWSQAYYPLLGDWATCGLAKLGVAIVADSEEIAAEALRLVKVEWEPLGCVLDSNDAMEPGAPIANPDAQEIMIPGTNIVDLTLSTRATDFSTGDVDEALAATDIQKITWNTKQKPQHMCGAEPSGCVAWWPDDETIEMWSHTQHPGDTGQYVCNWFNLDYAKFRSHLCYQGGMFGEGSEDGPMKLYPQMYILNAILAKRVGRPVKLMYDRRDSQVCFTFIGYDMNFTAGFKSDGTITAVDIDDVSWNSNQRLYSRLVDATAIPNIRIEHTFVDTNMGPSWAFRCEMHGPDLAHNQPCQHVAQALNMDPTEVATKNNGCEGEGVEFILETLEGAGFPVVDSLQVCLEAGKKAIDWDNKWHDPGTKKLPNGRMHGMGFHWAPEWSDLLGVGFVQIAFQPDGTARLYSQHADMGLNSPTWCSQIVAEEIGMKYEDIQPYFMEDVGFGQATPDSSMNLTRNGWVWVKAAQAAKRRLLEVATLEPQPGSWGRPDTPPIFDGDSPDDFDIEDSVIFKKDDPSITLPLSELLAMRNAWAGESGSAPVIINVRVGQMTPPYGTGNKGSMEFCRQTHFFEVEVDTDTGEVFITNCVTVNDVGKIINWGSCYGQCNGGAIMGLSRCMLEDPIWDPQTGGVLTDNMIDNHIATCLDTPSILQTIMVETEVGRGPYGSCGAGEDNGCELTECLEGAIYNATGVNVGVYPVTPLNVLKALGKA